MAIQYPIQDTDRFTVYDTNTSAPLNDGRGRPMRRVKWGSRDKTRMIPNLAPNIHWLLDVNESKPAFDSAIEKLEKTVAYDVDEQTATDGWEVVALTQAEIDAKVPAHYETTGGIKLDVSEQAQNAFSRMITLVNQAGMADADPVSVKDVYGVANELTVADFKAVMVAYGLHCYTLFMTDPVEEEIV